MGTKKNDKLCLNFTALDFETANYYPGSACALGIVVVREGIITEQRSWLLKPPVDNFNPEFIRLHGISPERVKDAPTFSDAWPEIKPYLSSSWLVAHNASFDLKVLSGTCRHYGLTTNSFSYICSLGLARNAWPFLRSHALNAIANHLSLTLNHHDAASDALVCAQLTLAACNQLGFFADIDLPLYHHADITVTHSPEVISGEDRLQEIRKERAKSVTVNSLNIGKRTGIINNFIVSEKSCSCPDFQERQKPCKHIYRLQMELAKLTELKKEVQ